MPPILMTIYRKRRGLLKMREPNETEEVSVDPSEKLQKVLARAGLGSRRELERDISAGLVKVNGTLAKLGDRVVPEDRIEFDGKPVRMPEADDIRVLLYNKPEGEICTRSDPEGRRTVFQSLPPRTHRQVSIENTWCVFAARYQTKLWKICVLVLS